MWKTSWECDANIAQCKRGIRLKRNVNDKQQNVCPHSVGRCITDPILASGDPRFRVRSKAWRLWPDQVNYWKGALQLLFGKLCHDYGSRSAWAQVLPDPDYVSKNVNLPLSPNTLEVLFNFCVICFCQRYMVEAAEPLQPPICPSPDPWIRVKAKPRMLKPDNIHNWEGALQLLFGKLCHDYGSRSAWAQVLPDPDYISKNVICPSPLINWRCSLTFVLYFFCQTYMVEAAEPLQPPFCPSPDPWIRVKAKPRMLKHDNIHNWEGALQLLFFKLFLKMTKFAQWCWFDS